jgi:hypothetical protein
VSLTKASKDPNLFQGNLGGSQSSKGENENREVNKALDGYLATYINACGR